MKLKTYRAESMADALVQVKNDLGSDAVILHTRTYRAGSVMGIGGRPMVEVTASASPDAMPPKVSLSGATIANAAGALRTAPRSASRHDPSAPARPETGSNTRPEPLVKPTSAGTYAAVPTVRLPSAPKIDAGDLAPPPATPRALDARTANPGTPPETTIENPPKTQVQRPFQKTVDTPKPQTPEPARTPEPVRKLHPAYIDTPAEPNKPAATPAASTPSTPAPTPAPAKAPTPIPPKPASNAEPKPAPRTPSTPTPEPAGWTPALPAKTTDPKTPAPKSPAAKAPSAPKPAAPKPSEPAPTQAKTPAKTEAPTTGAPATQPPSRDALEAEVAELKRMMQDVLRARTAPLVAGVATAPTDTRPIARYRARLLDQEVDDQTVDALMARVREVVGPEGVNDDSSVRAALLDEVAAIIPVRHDPPRERSPKGGPRRIALIGPTGVGKTTTVAKLAASYQLRYGLSVGLITLDTYRIAAVEQLRTYAGIIGLPIEVADAPDRVERARERLSSCDVIFIDSAGRSHNDAGRLEQLAQFVHAADPDEIHLVMSATGSIGTLARIAARFAPLRPDRCLLTKLDEAVTFGALAALPARVGLPLGFVTTGQEVPDHIEPASPSRLARLVVDGVGQSEVPSHCAHTTEGTAL